MFMLPSIQLNSSSLYYLDAPHPTLLSSVDLLRRGTDCGEEGIGISGAGAAGADISSGIREGALRCCGVVVVLSLTRTFHQTEG